jgi:quercetin dioxygenase-like cupin family protein
MLNLLVRPLSRRQSFCLHFHLHEQVGMVCAGKAMLRIGDEERVVQKGDFYCIPADTPHSDTCLGEEPFVMLDIFHPIREDLVEKLKREVPLSDRAA